MALSQQDKDCLVAYHGMLTRKHILDTTERGHLDDILMGEEAARVTAAKYYAENHLLVHVQSRLAEIDQEKTDLQAEEASLIAYTT